MAATSPFSPSSHLLSSGLPRGDTLASSLWPPHPPLAAGDQRHRGRSGGTRPRRCRHPCMAARRAHSTGAAPHCLGPSGLRSSPSARGVVCRCCRSFRTAPAGRGRGLRPAHPGGTGGRGGVGPRQQQPHRAAPRDGGAHVLCRPDSAPGPLRRPSACGLLAGRGPGTGRQPRGACSRPSGPQRGAAHAGGGRAGIHGHPVFVYGVRQGPALPGAPMSLGGPVPVVFEGEAGGHNWAGGGPRRTRRRPIRPSPQHRPRSRRRRQAPSTANRPPLPPPLPRPREYRHVCARMHV